MQVIFLDFDGVLNCEASGLSSIQQRIPNGADDSPANEDLCPVCTSTFQFVLESLPAAKIVVSSSWRLFFNTQQLKDILKRYGADGDRIVGVTPLSHLDQSNRGDDITAYLAEHPEVTGYGILDDNEGMTMHTHRFVQTDYRGGLTLDKALEFIKLMRGTGSYYLPPCPQCRFADLHYEPDSMNCFCRGCGHKTSAYDLISCPQVPNGGL